MKTLLKYFKGFEKETIIAPLFKMLEACFELFVPLVTARIIDIGIKSSDRRYILHQGILLVILGIVGLICSLTAQYFAAKAGMGVGANLRRDLYHHINTLDYEALDRTGTSTLITRITGDINTIQTGINLFLRLFMRAPFLVVGATIMAFFISPKVTMFFVIALALIGVTITIVMKWTMPRYKKVQEFLDQVVLHTSENYSGARVVRAFAREEDEYQEFAKVNDQLFSTQRKTGRVSGLLNPLTYAFANLGIVVIMIASADEVNIGGLGQGEVIALTNYMTQVLLALLIMANLIISVTRAFSSAARVSEVFALKPKMVEGERAVSEAVMEKSEAAVAFDHVSFTYHGQAKAALQDISFQAKRGSTIGVIGGTGSGKTTLVNLIERFYDVDCGQVLVGNTNVKEYTYHSLRALIGLVPQKAVLFTGTIRSNMQWRKPGASDEEIWAALKLAQAEEFVEKKPNQLAERVQAEGKNFSGGQRQRLTIARAFVGNPPVVILDDSASALDFATDKALRQGIKNHSHETTTFLVSQRVSTVRSADQILVLDNGLLVGKGTHEELFSTCQIYREICLSQLSKEEALTS